MADESKREAERNADGYAVVWEWGPWARFLGARAQLIKEQRAEGRSWEQIAAQLSCDPTQAQLIGMSELSGICGIPGAVWPPAEFQVPVLPVPPLASKGEVTERHREAAGRHLGSTRLYPADGWDDEDTLRLAELLAEFEAYGSASYDQRGPDRIGEARQLLTKMVRYVRAERTEANTTRLTKLVDQVADYLNRTHDPRDILRVSSDQRGSGVATAHHHAIAADIVKRCATWDGSEPSEDPEELIAQALAEAGQRGSGVGEGAWVVRPVVRWFAEQMELALRQNDHKGGWHEMDPLELCERIDDELLELKDSLTGCPAWGRISEAADVGAIAMMVADHFREGGPSQNQGHDLPAPPAAGSGVGEGAWVKLSSTPRLQSGTLCWVRAADGDICARWLYKDGIAGRESVSWCSDAAGEMVDLWDGEVTHYMPIGPPDPPATELATGEENP